MTRRPTSHTPWCARGHHCNLHEHRAHPIVVDTAGGRATLTRVQGARGAGYAEARITVALDPRERVARGQVATLLTNLETLLTAVGDHPWPGGTRVAPGRAALPYRAA